MFVFFLHDDAIAFVLSGDIGTRDSRLLYPATALFEILEAFASFIKVLGCIIVSVRSYAEANLTTYKLPANTIS